MYWKYFHYFVSVLYIGIFDTNLVTEAISDDVPSISTRPLLKPEQAVTEADFEVKSGEC